MILSSNDSVPFTGLTSSKVRPAIAIVIGTLTPTDTAALDTQLRTWLMF